MPNEPFVPDNITVHLGEPNEDAQNVSVNFQDYIKNVASSEIYPTWPENSIKANIAAMVTFALNRVNTGWYRNNGYPFDITNSEQYDQSFFVGHTIFDTISYAVDELFNYYVRKQGDIMPYFTAFCNGRTVTCPGLSQWGTVYLANKGYDHSLILAYYYGNDIELVQNFLVKTDTEIYPDIVLAAGMTGNAVKAIQTRLNLISSNYPEIPKIHPIDGIFNQGTENSVKKFQEIFNMPLTGAIDEAAWYRIAYKYNDIKKAARHNNLNSYPGLKLREGNANEFVQTLQLYLNYISKSYPTIPAIRITGYFGPMTKNSVIAFQKQFGLTPNGIAGETVWNKIFNVYSDLYQGFIKNPTQYPGYIMEGV